jgi:hypothetical protein
MNSKRKFGALFLLLAAAALWPSTAKRGAAAQDAKPDYKGNNCVGCHSRLLEPLGVGNRYLEWQFSRHQEKGVSCEKCHGGDPAATDPAKAHAGALPSTDRRSALHWSKQQGTCNACHHNVVSAFAESAHYKRLKEAGRGPSCGSCHEHMATKVIYSPAETGALCAQCHDPNHITGPRSLIPGAAKETVAALRRADGVIGWARLLSAEGRRWNLPIAAEEGDLRLAEKALGEAKVSWHTFDLENTRKQADRAFLEGMKARDGLRKKLGNE